MDDIASFELSYYLMTHSKCLLYFKTYEQRKLIEILEYLKKAIPPKDPNKKNASRKVSSKGKSLNFVFILFLFILIFRAITLKFDPCSRHTWKEKFINKVYFNWIGSGGNWNQTD